ncbi:hypothetical protein BC829DRAFT_431760 [Chytridium lagenaria]|nr:hypothetical protein BC829DRAFT_431760 [Chytridium lagenaria]
MDISKLPAIDFQESIDDDLHFIKKLWESYQATPIVQSNTRQSYANIILRSLLCHCHAKESVIFPLYQENIEGGQSVLTAAKVQYEHLRGQLRDLTTVTVSDSSFDEKLAKSLREFFAYSEQELRYHIPSAKESMHEDDIAACARDYDKTKKTKLDDETLVQGDTEDIGERIIRDHREVSRLFSAFDKAEDMERKRKIMRKLIKCLTIHSFCEELSVYPLYEKHISQGKDIHERAKKEHLNMKTLMSNIEATKDDGEYMDNVQHLRQLFTTHTRDEEEHELPALLKGMKTEDAIMIGQNFDKSRSTAPTHPHPNAPDSGGYMQKIAAAVAMPIDATRDALFHREE